MAYGTKRILVSGTIASLMLAIAGDASAASHLWRFNEIFSSADGSVQYLEMVEIGGSDNEWHLSGKTLHSNSNSYVFPNDLPPDTANRNFMVATESYAALPGVPAPDYVIPDNFFNPAVDTVQLHFYDIYSFTAGMLPTDGYHARDRMLEQNVANSPTNFSEETTVIDLSADADLDGFGSFLDNCTQDANPDQTDTDGDGHGNLCDADFNNSCGVVNFVDLAIMKAEFFTVNPLLDMDNSGGPVNFGDLAIMQALFFLPPGPSAPGSLCNP